MWSLPVDARIDATAGLQMSQPVPVPYLRDQAGEGADPGGRHDLEQLGPRLAEVLAQRLGLLHALGLEQLLEHGTQTAAGGAGGGAGLDRRHVARALGDGAADRALGDVVAGADLRVVGQRADTRAARSSPGSDQRAGSPGSWRPTMRPQRRVRGRVADQDAAQQRLRVVGDAPVWRRSLGRVVEHDLEAPSVAPMRVAEAGHVDAEQLELGRQVRARELRRAAEQTVGDHLGGGVARRDQPVAAALDRGHLADRVDVADRLCGKRCR